MIAFLRGKVLKKTDRFIVLCPENVGYLVHINKNLISKISNDDEIELFIHTNIREDAQDLYGFENFDELEFFRTLISVSGIGPKVGLEILNTDSSKFKSAIVNEDVAFISKTPGIGKKTAERLILELKNKITVDSLDHIHAGISNSTSDDIVDALIALGFSRHQVLKTLEKMPEEIKKEEEVISYFLKNN